MATANAETKDEKRTRARNLLRTLVFERLKVVDEIEKAQARFVRRVEEYTTIIAQMQDLAQSAELDRTGFGPPVSPFFAPTKARRLSRFLFSFMSHEVLRYSDKGGALKRSEQDRMSRILRELDGA